MSPGPVRPASVDRLLGQVLPRLEPGLDHAAVLAVAREVQADERSRLAAGEPPRSLHDMAGALMASLGAYAGMAGAGVVPAINATGVIVHTNLGRAGWPRAAIDAAATAAAGQSLLELDRGSGRRGRRYRVAEEHLIALTGAEDALITNNNAAAVALAVGLARRGRVIVSRGELVEIGGGVRIPEIVRRAGARLVEVGTTNRTRAADYEAPLAEGRGGLILRVHRSNFRQEGFVEEPDLAELSDLARRHGAPLIDDLGSGALLDTADFGLAHEPMPRERLTSGADLVSFSGDKLTGGPQAGLLAGRADLIARIRRDPLARAMRPDKVTLAGVAATLALYRAGRATLDIPVWRAIAADVEALRTRATLLRESLTRAFAVVAGAPSGSLEVAPLEVVASRATVGGGSLPGETMPSIAVAVRHGSAARLLARLRQSEPCVVARVEGGAVILDLRTVDPSQDHDLERALHAALRADPP